MLSLQYISFQIIFRTVSVQREKVCYKMVFSPAAPEINYTKGSIERMQPYRTVTQTEWDKDVKECDKL